MKYLRNYIKTTLIVLAVISTTAVYVAERSAPKLGYRLSPIAKPFKATDFSLYDMDEDEINFTDFKGKVVLLNFWASWCPPCRREMPSMEHLHQNFKGQNFAVIAINQMEEEDDIFAYTGELEVEPTFTILFDKDSSVSDQYPVVGLPTTFLIDKKGVVRYRAVGGREFDHPEVMKLIQKLIDE